MGVQHFHYRRILARRRHAFGRTSLLPTGCDFFLFSPFSVILSRELLISRVYSFRCTLSLARQLAR